MFEVWRHWEAVRWMMMMMMMNQWHPKGILWYQTGIRSAAVRSWIPNVRVLSHIFKCDGDLWIHGLPPLILLRILNSSLFYSTEWRQGKKDRPVNKERRFRKWVNLCRCKGIPEGFPFNLRRIHEKVWLWEWKNWWDLRRKAGHWSMESRLLNAFNVSGKSSLVKKEEEDEYEYFVGIIRWRDL